MKADDLHNRFTHDKRVNIFLWLGFTPKNQNKLFVRFKFNGNQYWLSVELERPIPMKPEIEKAVKELKTNFRRTLKDLKGGSYA